MRRHLLIGLIGWTVVLLFCVSPYASESAKADGVVLSMTRTAVGGGIYTPCQTLYHQVDVTRSGDGAVTAAGIEETLPAGWTFHSVLPDGSGVPTIVPRPGAEGVLSFAWFDLQGAGIPGFPLSFVYRVNVPCSETGDETVSGLCLYRYLLDNGSSSGEQQTAVQSTVVSLTTEPQTFYVSKQGAAKAAGTHADPFAAIADAVKATVSGRGDTIVVGDGVYRESPVLKRNTTLYGERGAFHTRIVSPSDDTAAIVTAGDGCVVRRLAIGGAGNGSAVLVKDGAQAELTNLVLFANHTGVYASTNANVTFSNNTIYGNTGYGVFSADEAYFDVLMHSLFISNNVGVHITLDAVGEGTHNAYFNNTLHQDGHAPHGTHLFVDPLFVDAALLNFHLKLHSPVRDAGDPDTEHNDVDGSRNDLGADGGPFGVQDTTSPAVVIITNPSPPVVGVDMPIGLDVSGSTDEWGIAAYEWDFEASDVFVPDADTPYIEYRFASPGEHVVKLRVTDHGGLQTMASVTVQVNTYALRLMSPNGGEVWPLGKTVRIAWEDLTGLYTGDVRLSLYGNGIAPHSITQTAGNLGYFDWVIPKNLPPGGGYRVRLESVSHPPLFDVSDGDFVIVAQDNDSLSGAVWIGTDGPPISEQFHYPRDENWYAFCVPPDLVGQQIDMALTFQDPSFDALLELFWDNGAGPIAEAALPIPGNPERRIAWTPIEAGCYRIRVVGVDSSLYGPRTSHTLRVWHPSGTVAAGAIGGLVRDAVTWAPISGARVTADFAGLTALTTPAGAYRFEALPQGTYTLSVEAPGYLAGTRQVVLASGAIETANFDLPSLAAVPPPQEVSASDGTFAGQVRVTWRSVPWATGYRVFRDGVALNACTFIESLDDRPESSAVHLYQVQTCYPGGSSELSAPDTGYRAGVPDYPVWVLASNGDFADRVRVSWAPVPGASYYRVYRFGPEQTPVDGDIEAAVEQMQPSLEDAAPVGDWTAATWMDDTSAEVPATRWSCRGDEAVYNVYLYAVVAGNTAGESLPSVWNEGYVGSETAEGESVYEPVLPSRPVTGSKRAALPESELALRLVSSDTIDADSVWGQVVCAAFEDDQVEWRPLQANDGWVVYRPTEPWRPGDSVTMTAGALTSDGAVVGPVSYEFIIEAADPGNAKAEVWQPSDADFDSTGMDAEIPAELEVAPPDTVLLPGAVSPLYRIAPDGLYDAPRRVWLPVPNGIINPVHALRYGVQTDAGTAWHPATAVAGWLVEGSALELNLGGGRYLGILARHG
ncbi:MAG: hypothetical protein QG656_2452, partial [Candidatus Hydrogenedentes bacterium]|nr:hypothetical protein [Candidatus Hydrogenedentota bacterium]